MNNTTYIKIKGYNLEKILNKLSKNNIKLHYVRRENKYVIIGIDYSDMSIAQKILDEYGYEVVKLGSVGVKHKFKLLYENWFVVLGCILVFLLCFYLGNTVQTIKVEANGICDEKLVKELASECGLKKSMRTSDINRDYIENALSIRIEEAQYVILGISGSIVTIQLIPKIPLIPVIPTNPCDIIASQDGVITRIAVIRGTAMVKKGDRVYKGQVLIKGETIFPDGSYEQVRALGYVYAQVSVKGYASYEPYKSVYERTGKFTVITTYSILNITTKPAKNHNYEYYETETEKIIMAPAPIVMNRTIIYELYCNKVSVSFEACYNELYTKASIAAKEKADFEIEKLETYNEEKPIITVVVVATGQKLISVDADKNVNN